MADSITFTDSDDVRWVISEGGAENLLSELADPSVTWLSFESDLEVRRLWGYPDDWDRLKSRQLDALCRKANTVVARFPRSAERSQSHEVELQRVAPD